MIARVFPVLIATALASAAAQRPNAHAEHHMAGTPGMTLPVTVPQGAQYTEADVRFMQGMIAHHAQAIYMSKMAGAHGANPHLLKFTQKIEQSQTAEIRIMLEWLRANDQVAPDTSAWRTMQMPGMLSAEQLRQLDAAQGREFDRQFLVLMIQHHQGALKMVDDLLATPRAAQDIDVSVFVSDVVTVQTAEIGTMQQMLTQLDNGTH